LANDTYHHCTGRLATENKCIAHSWHCKNLNKSRDDNDDHCRERTFKAGYHGTGDIDAFGRGRATFVDQSIAIVIQPIAVGHGILGIGQAFIGNRGTDGTHAIEETGAGLTDGHALTANAHVHATGRAVEWGFRVHATQCKVARVHGAEVVVIAIGWALGDAPTKTTAKRGRLAPIGHGTRGVHGCVHQNAWGFGACFGTDAGHARIHGWWARHIGVSHAQTVSIAVVIGDAGQTVVTHRAIGSWNNGAAADGIANALKARIRRTGTDARGGHTAIQGAGAHLTGIQTELARGLVQMRCASGEEAARGRENITGVRDTVRGQWAISGIGCRWSIAHIGKMGPVANGFRALAHQNAQITSGHRGIDAAHIGDAHTQAKARIRARAQCIVGCARAATAIGQARAHHATQESRALCVVRHGYARAVGQTGTGLTSRARARKIVRKADRAREISTADTGQATHVGAFAIVIAKQAIRQFRIKGIRATAINKAKVKGAIVVVIAQAVS